MIFFLAKVFSEPGYADELIEGKLYANRFNYFKKIENDHIRGDSEEGAIMPQLDGLTIELTGTDSTTGEVNTIRISKEDLAEPPVIRPQWFDDINIFCMYAAHTKEFKNISEANINDFKKRLEMPKDCQEFGNHAVLIKNTREFIRRVKLSAKKKGYKFYSGLVQYYDPTIGTPPIQSPIQTVFLKRRVYEYQKEWRLAMKTGTTGDDPIILEIGSIEDIAVRVSTPDLIRFQSFQVMDAEDEMDLATARMRLLEIENDPSRLVKGEELRARLGSLET